MVSMEILENGISMEPMWFKGERMFLKYNQSIAEDLRSSRNVEVDRMIQEALNTSKDRQDGIILVERSITIVQREIILPRK